MTPKQAAYAEHRRNWTYTLWLEGIIRRPLPGDEIFHPANDEGSDDEQ